MYKRGASGSNPETAPAVVSDAGFAAVNGTYPRDGSRNGKPLYVLGINAISWEAAGYWTISDSTFSVLFYFAERDEPFPWDVTATWDVADADEPAPTVTMG